MLAKVYPARPYSGKRNPLNPLDGYWLRLAIGRFTIDGRFTPGPFDRTDNEVDGGRNRHQNRGEHVHPDSEDQGGVVDSDQLEDQAPNAVRKYIQRECPPMAELESLVRPDHDQRHQDAPQ